MRYYKFDKYPIEFVLSENIDKHFDSHNHAGHYVISVVMQGAAAAYLENRELECHRGDVFIIPPYAMHSVHQGRDARLLSMCIETAFVEETALGAAEGIIRDLLKDAVDLSKYYLIRKFKSSIGMTPHQFRIQNRIRKSQGLLGAGKTVGEISVEMGFYDQSHFNKAFQRIVGISPSEYASSKNIIEQMNGMPVV